MIGGYSLVAIVCVRAFASAGEPSRGSERSIHRQSRTAWVLVSLDQHRLTLPSSLLLLALTLCAAVSLNEPAGPAPIDCCSSLSSANRSFSTVACCSRSGGQLGYKQLHPMAPVTGISRPRHRPAHPALPLLVFSLLSLPSSRSPSRSRSRFSLLFLSRVLLARGASRCSVSGSLSRVKSGCAQAEYDDDGGIASRVRSSGGERRRKE